jgi:Fic family protein
MPKRRQLSGKSKSTRGVDAPSDNAQTQIGHPGDGEPDSRIFTFLSGLNEDLRTGLMAQMRILWTHTSTAIEGNSLTLGDTAFVLGEGLTVQGKPLKDHEEVVGHATAIDLMYDLLKRDSEITDQDLFLLHRAVQASVIVDVYRPIGNWKREPNGTYYIDSNSKTEYIEYAPPQDVPNLMQEWLSLLNGYSIQHELTADEALDAYARLHVSFVRIHPFFDGNGRLARLLSNVPVLKAGEPPILIPKEERQAYLHLLNEYEVAVGQARLGQPLLPELEKLSGFRHFCERTWNASRELVDLARRQQRIRDSRR